MLEYRYSERNNTNIKEKTITGIAASYGTEATIVDQRGQKFVEVIHRDAFRSAIESNQDVRMLVEHNPELILGRTKSGTLKIQDTDRGLYFECDLPDNSLGNDIRESIRRGDIDGCSFGFKVKKDEWENRNGVLVRTLLEVDLYDISVVTYPAYETGTSVDLRSVNLKSKSKQWCKNKLWIIHRSI